MGGITLGAVRTFAKYVAGLLLLVISAFAAPAEKPPLNHPMMGVANGCFVETVAFLDHWKQVNGDAWARLLQWGARSEDEVVMGHAVAICEARDALWSWDINHGWNRLPVETAQRETVESVAAPVLKKYPKVSARYPTYRFDFPQTPAGTPPMADLANSNTALRDASVVGAQLSRARPVNVVRFTYGSGEEKRESAAAVFVFHGRYCVYVPEAGTVPFRVHTGVENLRVIQELLRRIFPGASDVRKM